MPLFVAAHVDARSTAFDVVRVFHPTATAADVEHVLWEQSCWPVGGIDDWLPQVRDAWLPSEVRP